MTASDDHGTLPVHAERMLQRLETIENLAVTGETAHMQHMDHAKRVRQLAHHLRAVLLLSEAHHYPSALVVVRSALEHHLMDRLIFLANRYIVTYTRSRRRMSRAGTSSSQPLRRATSQTSRRGSGTSPG
jgi:non-ribosomal peptide synthetase component F